MSRTSLSEVCRAKRLLCRSCFACCAARQSRERRSSAAPEQPFVPAGAASVPERAPGLQPLPREAGYGARSHPPASRYRFAVLESNELARTVHPLPRSEDGERNVALQIHLTKSSRNCKAGGQKKLGIPQPPRGVVSVCYRSRDRSRFSVVRCRWRVPRCSGRAVSAVTHPARARGSQGNKGIGKKHLRFQSRCVRAQILCANESAVVGRG